MDDGQRNVRTLIVCFVVAIMVLVPLRFVEEGQIMLAEQEKVLGQRVVVEAGKLEAPYEQMETEGCLSEEMGARLIEMMTSDLARGNYDQQEVDQAIRVVGDIEARICR